MEKIAYHLPLCRLASHWIDPQLSKMASLQCREHPSQRQEPLQGQPPAQPPAHLAPVTPRLDATTTTFPRASGLWRDGDYPRAPGVWRDGDYLVVFGGTATTRASGLWRDGDYPRASGLCWRVHPRSHRWLAHPWGQQQRRQLEEAQVQAVATSAVGEDVGASAPADAPAAVAVKPELQQGDQAWALWQGPS